MRYIVPLLLLCCLMLSSGCASLYGVYDDQRLSGTITDDKEISLGIKSDLMDANLSQGWGIKVYCYYGHIFLVGEAPEKMRSQAIRIARRHKGVRSVTSHWFTPAKSETGDFVLATKLRTELIGTSGLSSTRIDTEGNAWRAYDFVENTVCLQQVGCEADFRTVAETLGKFQNQLADYPASTLHETIARFHDTPNRYANFEKALAADALGRAKTIAPEIAFIRAREKDCHVLLDQLAAGEIPLRVTHNDTKINNVLLDEATGKGICVIDLDTVMPGLSAYDFGDSIRTGANDCAEDEPDQSKVHFDLHLYEVFAKGYLSTAGSTMHTAEKKSLAWGAKLMTLECGIRFLTDYLEGDHYFHIARPNHNLDRARTQFTLVRQMEDVFDQMTAIVCPETDL